MNTCERIAAYVSRASWNAVSPEARGKLKQHLLDTVGCALGAVPEPPIEAIRREEEDLRLTGPCTLIGGGTTTPERAAFYNGALVRYLDFMDTFLAPGEACHPSDNFAALLAAAELANASGRDFLAALALSYHVQCSFTSSGVPIMRNGLDHTLQLGVSLAAGVSFLLKLTPEQTANAIALCAVSSLSAASSRAGEHLSNWKGLASAGTAFNCMHNVRLAQHGITGPLEVFGGRLGLEELLGKPFAIDWENENYDGILACSLKAFNAEFHAQPVIEGVLELRNAHGLTADGVARVQIDFFKAGYDMIGGGKYLDPLTVSTKEDADHSLNYLVAVALLDGELWPEQFSAERIQSEDVQSLMPKVVTWLSMTYTRDYPNRLRCKIRMETKDGRSLETEKDGFTGFFRSPMPIEMLLGKFRRLASRSASPAASQKIIEAIARIEDRPIRELTTTLSDLKREQASPSAS